MSRTYGEKDREALLGDVMSAMKTAIEHRAVGLLDKPAEITVGRYRGLDIEVYARRDEIRFTLSGADSYEPDNLRYRAEEKFSLNGFIHRLDNIMGRFEDWRQEAEDTRAKERHEYAKATVEQGKPFPQQQRLEALRQDVGDVMTELKLMQADDNYVSQWQPRSLANDMPTLPPSLDPSVEPGKTYRGGIVDITGTEVAQNVKVTDSQSRALARGR